MARSERKENRTKLARSKSAARARVPNTGRDVGRRPYEITVVVLGGTRKNAIINSMESSFINYSSPPRNIEVGKSALVSQFLWDSFPVDYRPTVDEFNWIEYDIGDGSVLMLQMNYPKRAQRMIVGPLQIIDSSGSHDFLAMRHFYIRTGDAFMVVFSIDDAASLEEAKRIIEEIEEERDKTVPVILVANKCDLYDDVMKWEAKRSHQYAYNRSIPIVECTAKCHDEATDVFKGLLEGLRDRNRIGMTEMTKRR
ncbi:unnamed protein product [Angiostrongylus costaricensis]|uniref:GTP-binding protein n=1 Tax=Angiostrongylus costaricensis TaxID=334426 RepID=A0A0R3PK69_ANGCS|nr:unnamed protein product [Angiostrongylus costaricensis]